MAKGQALANAGILPAEFREEFERIGEAAVIYRLAKFESRARREAALEWLRQRRDEREQIKHRQLLQERERDRRWMIIAATVIGCVHIMAGIAIAWY